MTIEQVMNNKNFDKELGIIVINNNRPITFTKEDYEVIEGIPRYTDSKKEGRSGSATAIISPNTLAIYTSANIEYPEPINWSKTIQEMKIYNKCHIIAYSLSAKKANPVNLFIGTDYLNKKTMKKIEKEIYDYVKDYKRTFLYKVTLKYKYKEDVVPIGILIEAETIDSSEKIYICRFCYNIQEGTKINYYDGSDIPIEESYGKRITKIKTTRQSNEKNNKYKEYDINVKTKTFHLSSKECSAIKNLEPKYIQETKAYEKEILSKEFKLCKKCIL